MEDTFMTQKPKRVLKGFLFAIVAVVLSVALIIIFVSFHLFSSPKYQLTKAFKKTFTDVNSPLSEYLGLHSLKEEIGTQPYRQRVNVNLEDISQYRDMLTLAPSVSIENRLDYAGAKSETDISLLLGSSDVLSAVLYAQSDSLSLSIPELYDSAFQMDTTTLGRDFNASVLSDISKLSVNDNLGFRLFQNADSFFELYLKHYSDDFKLLGSQLSINPEDIIVLKMDGIEFTCKSYSIRLPREICERTLRNAAELAKYRNVSPTLIQTLVDALISELPEDGLQAMVFVDKNSGLIKKAELDNESLHLTWVQQTPEESSILLEAALLSANPAIKHTLLINSVTKGLIMNREVKYSITEGPILMLNTSYDPNTHSLSGKSSYETDQEQYYSMEFKGDFSDVISGKSFHLMLEECHLTVSNNIKIDFSGEYSIAPMKEGEAVHPPQSNTVKPLFMNRPDLYGIGYTMLKNAAKTTLGSLLSYL